MKNRQLRLLSYIVIIYMLLAFSWWSVLLYTKNQDAFQAKSQYQKLVMIAEQRITNEQQYQQTPEYRELRLKYKRQEWMIFGEASVFVLSLVIGIWLINRSYYQEVEAAGQRRNFLLSITHELKSPIASIKLILETFLKRNLSKEQADAFCESAVQEADRLNSLVNDLLLAAKMEFAYQPNLEPLNLVELLENILAKLRTKYPEATFRLDVKNEIDEIWADRLGITSVALNLLENAVKYSPQHPDIKITISSDSKYVHWHTADHGTGIPDKEKAKVFERFYRIGNEDTRQTKGTGLGLYIVKEIVKAHGGTITLVDNEPQGSVFSIKLPISVNAENNNV